MSPRDPRQDDDLFDRLLADYDEALAHGTPPGPPVEAENAELRERLAEARACIDLLEANFPRHPGSTLDGSLIATAISPLFPPPTTIGRFVIRRELGRGGHGVVFLAYDPKLKREVALKVPRPETLHNAEMRSRFRREAEGAARLEHPHLISLYEAGEIGPVCYLVSAYCPGPTLAAWLRAHLRPIPAADAVRLIAPLADAVDYMHGQGILHRDIKPANVILQFPSCDIGDTRIWDGADYDLQRAIPKITDFGLVHLGEEATLQTQTGAVLGTPGYMSPEQAEGKRDEVGPATDIHALGVLLYELLTGRPPFRGTTDLDTLRQVISDDPVPPRHLRNDVPRDLETVVLKCLEKNPARRYPAAAGLAEDLRRVVAGEPIVARRASLQERAQKWIKRRPKLSTALAATAVGVLIFSWAGVWLAHSERKSATQLSTRLRQADDEVMRSKERSRKLASEEYPKSMKLAWLAWSGKRDWLEMQRILDSQADKVQTFDLAGFEWHYLRQILFDVPAELSGHAHIVDPLTASPDGRFLASSGRDNRTILWDLYKDPSPRVLASSNRRGRGDFLRFSPDRREVAYFWNQDGKGIICRWDVASGSLLQGWELDHTLTSLQYVAQGKELLFNQQMPSGDQLCFRKLQPETWESADRFLYPVDRLVPTDNFRSIHGGERLILASADAKGSNEYKVRVADAKSGNIEYTCFSLGNVHSRRALAHCIELVVSADEALVAAIFDNTEIRWGKIESQAKVLTFRHYMILSAGFSADGKTLGVGTSDLEKCTAKIVFLDVETGRQTDEWILAPVETWSLAQTDDWRTVYQGAADSKIHVNRRTGREKTVLPGHAPAEAWGLAFSPDGKRLISGGDDSSIRVWNLETLQQERNLTGHGSLVTNIAYRSEPDTFASVDYEGKLILWDGSRLEPIIHFQSHPGRLRAVAFSPDNNYLAFAGGLGQLWICDPSKGPPRQSLRAANRRAHRVNRLFPG